MRTTGRTKTWLALAPAMALPFVAALFYFVLFGDRPFARVIYGATKVFTVVWPAAAVWLIFRTRFPKLELRAGRHLRAIPLGLVTGAAIALLMFGLMQTPLGGMVSGGAEAMRQKARAFGVLEHYWLFAVALSVVHSLVEEYYWRWFVFGRLRSVCRPAHAHVLAGAAFAAHHVVIATQFFPLGWGIVLGGLVGVGGIVWSVMYDRQRTLAGAWASHLIVDFGIMAIGHKLLFGGWL